MYINRQGWSKVNTYGYCMVRFRAQPFKLGIWQDGDRENDDLSICISLEDVRTIRRGYPFPSCDAPLDGAESRNGGKVCMEDFEAKEEYMVVVRLLSEEVLRYATNTRIIRGLFYTFDFMLDTDTIYR